MAHLKKASQDSFAREQDKIRPKNKIRLLFVCSGEAVESYLVKLETSCTVKRLPMVSVLCSHSNLIHSIFLSC